MHLHGIQRKCVPYAEFADLLSQPTFNPPFLSRCPKTNTMIWITRVASDIAAMGRRVGYIFSQPCSLKIMLKYIRLVRSLTCCRVLDNPHREESNSRDLNLNLQAHELAMQDTRMVQT